MNISNYYWYFKSAIPPKICDDIIKYGLTQAETMARTGGYGDKELNKDQIRDMKRKRNSDLVWLKNMKLPHQQWHQIWFQEREIQFLQCRLLSVFLVHPYLSFTSNHLLCISVYHVN